MSSDSDTDILVTGCAGFIGSHVADRLVALGHRVVGLDDLSGGFNENIPEWVDYVEGSITHHDTLRGIFDRHKFSRVYHLAAYACESMSHRVRRFNYYNNLVGSVNLINEAIRHKVECFVFASSAGVYGDCPHRMTEEDVPKPIDPYGIAKLAVEMDLAAARRKFGLNSIIFRPHNVYGPRQNMADPNRNVVAVFVRKALEGLPLPIVGDGKQVRCFSYIDDVTKVIAESPNNPRMLNETYNVGSNNARTVLELAYDVSDAVGVPLDAEHLPGRDEARKVELSHGKLDSVLGLPEAHARTPLKKGLAKMVEWARTATLRPMASFKNVELED